MTSAITPTPIAGETVSSGRVCRYRGDGISGPSGKFIGRQEGLPDADVITEPIEEPEQTSVLVVESQMRIALISLREALATKDEVIESQQQTISAIERHVTDLQEENQRLRQQLETSPETVESSQTRVSWLQRLITRLGGNDGRSI